MHMPKKLTILSFHLKFFSGVEGQPHTTKHKMCRPVSSRKMLQQCPLHYFEGENKANPKIPKTSSFIMEIKKGIYFNTRLWLQHGKF